MPSRLVVSGGDALRETPIGSDALTRGLGEVQRRLDHLRGGLREQLDEDSST